VSEVSEFTADGSPPRNVQMNPDSDAAAHCHSGDMYDAMTAASMAARYAAAHVMNLGSSVGMVPGAQRASSACNHAPEDYPPMLIRNLLMCRDTALAAPPTRVIATSAAGFGGSLPQLPRPPAVRQGRGHTRRFSASAAIKPSARRQSAEALLQQMRHNTRWDWPCQLSRLMLVHLCNPRSVQDIGMCS
jgi:hypothetical protein